MVVGFFVVVVTFVVGFFVVEVVAVVDVVTLEVVVITDVEAVVDSVVVVISIVVVVLCIEIGAVVVVTIVVCESPSSPSTVESEYATATINVVTDNTIANTIRNVLFKYFLNKVCHLSIGISKAAATKPTKPSGNDTTPIVNNKPLRHQKRTFLKTFNSNTLFVFSFAPI